MKRTRAECNFSEGNSNVSEERPAQRQRINLENVRVVVFNRIYVPVSSMNDVNDIPIADSMDIDPVGENLTNNLGSCTCSSKHVTGWEDDASSYSCDAMDIDWCVCMNRQYQ